MWLCSKEEMERLIRDTKGRFTKGLITPWTFKKGHKVCKGSEKGWFKKGNKPTNLGQRKYSFICKNCKANHLTSLDRGEYCNIQCYHQYKKIGKFNPELSYRALHKWVIKNKPRSEACEECNSFKKLDAANISGKYKKDINDFKWLCRKCHSKLDKKT